MTDSEREILDCIIPSRLDIAFQRLRSNAQYQEKCRIQQQVEEAAKEKLGMFGEQAIHVLLDYSNSQGDTICDEYDEIYLQGLRDCVKILTLLGVIGDRDGK